MVRIVVTIENTSSGEYRARCPSLPGCVADGKTAEEAWRGIRRAVEGYVASLNATAHVCLHTSGDEV